MCPGTQGTDTPPAWHRVPVSLCCASLLRGAVGDRGSRKGVGLSAPGTGNQIPGSAPGQAGHWEQLGQWGVSLPWQGWRWVMFEVPPHPAHAVAGPCWSRGCRAGCGGCSEASEVAVVSLFPCSEQHHPTFVPCSKSPARGSLAPGEAGGAAPGQIRAL